MVNSGADTDTSRFLNILADLGLMDDLIADDAEVRDFLNNLGPLETAYLHFEEEGLSFPPVPRELGEKLAFLAPWSFGTRSNAPPLYHLPLYIEELLSKHTEDYLAMGHAGHGINSCALHYYLVHGPVAVFVQLMWGGAFTDSEPAAERFATVCSQARAFIETAWEALRNGCLSGSERFLVVHSDFHGKQWARLDSKDVRWNPDKSPLVAARDAMAALTTC